ncbi:hypothetical protein BDV97DRAFT_372755 [Delphinella strobiligena]|nr:hypothetical protein BDV97DRAFT_372755 [Delphinella strobiligena]
MSATPRNDPAELEHPKSPCCVCKEHPAYQSPNLKEMDWTKVRNERIEYCLYAAIDVFHGNKICDKNFFNPVTGEQYDLCRAILVGKATASASKCHKLIIGEACSTAAAAVESVEQTLHMIQTCEYNEDIVIESFPVIAYQYSWKKCSVCYNARKEPVVEQPTTSPSKKGVRSLA